MSAHTLEVLGCIAAAAGVTVAILSPNPRTRTAALLFAMALAVVLVAGQGWDEIQPLRDRPVAFAGVVVGGALVLGAVAAAMLRWPVLLPLLLIAALPFRIRLHVAGGEGVNLLIPLYAVIGAGVLASAVAALRDPSPRRTLPAPLGIPLAAAVCLYALQASYSTDVAFAARNVGFFLVPFAVLLVMLAEARWTRRLLFGALAVVVAEALILAGIGIGQHIAEHIFWNGKLDQSNDFHFYFRVNSLFWDPNIYGRYLVLAILLSLGVLLWITGRLRAMALVAALAVLAAGLLFSFSQTSFIALFAGLFVLAALRWSVLWAAIAAPIAVAAVVAGVLLIGNGNTSDSSPAIDTEGHGTLISGGLRLARHRPILGYGSASFSKQFAEAEHVKAGETTISHSEPVTVAAEQGAVGIAVYLALLVGAIWTLFAGIRRIAPGFGAPFRGLDEGERTELPVARIAIAAAYVALLIHTIGYASYLTDPLTWALLAVGGGLAAEAGVSWPARLRR